MSSRVWLLLLVSACSSKTTTIEFDFPAGREGTQILIVTRVNDGSVSAFASSLDRQSFEVPLELSAGDLLHLDAAIYGATLEQLGLAEGALVPNPNLAAHRLIPDDVFSLEVSGGAAGEWSRRDGELPETVSKFLPLDPIANEVCRIPDLGEMKPFGTEAQIALPPMSVTDDRYKNLERVRFIDRTRAIVRTHLMLMLVERDRRHQIVEAKPRTPGNTIFIETMERSDGVYSYFPGLIVDPVPLPDGRRRAILLVGDFLEGTQELRGWLYNLIIGPRGFEEIEDFAMVPGQALGLTMDHTGAIAVYVGDGRTVLIARDGRTRELPPIPAGPLPYLPCFITATGDVDRPWAISGVGMLYVFEARASRWDATMIPTEWFPEDVRPDMDRYIPFDGVAAARTSSGALELWSVGGTAGIVRKIGGGPWTPIYPVLPPRYEGCAHKDTSLYPRLSFGEKLDEVMVDGEYLHISMGCNATLQLRRSDQCAALTTITGESISERRPRLWSLDLVEGDVVAAGEAGTVVVAERAR